MPTSLMRRMFRERRRIALVMLLVFVAARLAGIDPGPLPTAAIALLTGAFATLVALAAPRCRRFPAAMAFAGLALAGLMRAFPGSSLDLAGARGDGLVAFLVWLALIALARAAARALRAMPLPRLRRLRFRARAASPVDIYRLWYGLVPTPGMAAHYGDPDLVAIEEMSLRLGRVRLVTRAAAEPAREAVLQILEVEAPFHIRLRTNAQDARGVMAATGESEIFLVDLGASRLVLFSHDFRDMPLHHALRAWLDDAPGRMLDRRLATIDRRARREDADGSAPQASAASPAPGADWDDDADIETRTALHRDRSEWRRVS